MQEIINEGGRPQSIKYNLSVTDFLGAPCQETVNALSSVTFTEMFANGGSVPYDLGIWVYKSTSDAQYVYNDLLHSEAGCVNYMNGPAYWHEKCLLLGSPENSIPWQVVTKYCI